MRKIFGEKRKRAQVLCGWVHFLRLVKGLRLTEDEVWEGRFWTKKNGKMGRRPWRNDKKETVIVNKLCVYFTKYDAIFW